MSYNALMLEFPNFIKFIEEDLKNATSATENTRSNLATMIDNIAELDDAQVAALASAGNERLSDQGNLKTRARAMFVNAWAPAIAEQINSPTLSGGVITDLEQFFDDWNQYMADNDEHVTPRAVTYAADPAAQNGGTRLLRLTVDRFGNKIESGRHSETVSVKVDSKPAAGRVAFLIQNSDGPKDDLDYQTARPNPITIEAVNDINGASQFVGNPFMTGNADTTDNAAVTVMTGWTLEDTVGSPTLLIAKGATELWRDRVQSYSISGFGTTKTIKRLIPSRVLSDYSEAFVPCFPVMLPTGGTWTGTIKITWGSKSQTFTQADLTAGTFVNLIPDIDADLYAFNFDSAAPYYEIEIATTIAAEEIIFPGFMVTDFTARNGNGYAIFSGETDPEASDVFTGWADSNTYAGETQDILGYIFDDELPHAASLRSVGTTNRPVDPA